MRERRKSEWWWGVSVGTLVGLRVTHLLEKWSGQGGEEV